MPSPTDIYADLQDKFKALHANYGKMPRADFERRSVELVELMNITENYIKIQKQTQ